MVIIELALVFELFEGVVIFELFDRPSTWSSLDSLLSWNTSKAWSIQLTLQSAVFLRHATFQAFYMHFNTTYFKKISLFGLLGHAFFPLAIHLLRENFDFECTNIIKHLFVLKSKKKKELAVLQAQQFSLKQSSPKRYYFT